MSGEHVSNYVTLQGDRVPAKDRNIMAIAFEVVVSVTGIVFFMTYNTSVCLRLF